MARQPILRARHENSSFSCAKGLKLNHLYILICVLLVFSLYRLASLTPPSPPQLSPQTTSNHPDSLADLGNEVFVRPQKEQIRQFLEKNRKPYKIPVFHPPNYKDTVPVNPNLSETLSKSQAYDVEKEMSKVKYHPNSLKNFWEPFPNCTDKYTTFDNLKASVLASQREECGQGESFVETFMGKYWHGTNIKFTPSKRTVGKTTATLAKGAFSGQCTPKQGPRTTTGHARGFEGSPTSPMECKNHIKETTIVIKRDLCDNTWHAMSDYVALNTMQRFFGIDPLESRILIMDQKLMCSGANPGKDPTPREVDCLEPSCPYAEVWNVLGRKGVMKAVDISEDTCFDDLYMLLGNFEELWAKKFCPAEQIFPHYIKLVQDYFGFKHKAAPIVPASPQPEDVVDISVVLLKRKKKLFSTKEAARQFLNISDFIDEFSTINQLVIDGQTYNINISLSYPDLAVIPFREQLEIVSKADIYMGMHGAGLSHVVFTPPHSHLIEFVPFTWQADEYWTLTKKLKKPYSSWRNPHRSRHFDDTCKIPPDADISTLDICRGAVTLTYLTNEEVIPVVMNAVVEMLKRVGRQQGTIK